MLRDNQCPLLCKPETGDIYQSVTCDEAEWPLLNFGARKMAGDQKWKGHTGNNEYGIILLSGNYSVITDKGEWKTLNGRKSVFEGMAHVLYLPRNTEFEILATSAILDLAYGWCETDQDHPPRFKTPEEVSMEIRGGDNATRQINELIQPGFDCHRIVAVEAYTPSGNWSSYPAHKHDERIVDNAGNLKEAELVETYFYKIDKPNGFAIQHIYSADDTLNEVAIARNDHLVLVPRGYHPVAAGHGYHVYYLNFLAGSDQSLANTPDPDHEWIFGTWESRDPRVPMVTATMNSKP